MSRALCSSSEDEDSTIEGRRRIVSHGKNDMRRKIESRYRAVVGGFAAVTGGRGGGVSS